MADGVRTSAFGKVDNLIKLDRDESERKTE